MAREYVKAWFSIFTDEDFAHLSHADKWLYMTLLGQPALNYAGVQPINMRRWRKAMRNELGMPSEDDVEKMLIRLESREYVYTDEETGEVLVRSFMRVDEIDKQPNVLKSGLRALAQIESPKLAAVMLKELGRLTVPKVKSDKIGTEIDRLWSIARTHLEGLAEGITEPFPKPFAEPYSEPLPEGLPRPGKTEPLPEGSVVVEVEVEGLPPEVVKLGGSRETSENRSDPSEADPEIDGPPRNSIPGNDPEPPIRCKAHIGDPDHNAPCRPCANFRQAHDRWTARQRRSEAQSRSAAAWQRAEVTRAAIAACNLCDDRGYHGTQVCDHDLDAAERNRRAAQRARETVTAALQAKRGNPAEDRDSDSDPPEAT